MPYKIVVKRCKQADGGTGKVAVMNQDGSKKSCHNSKEKAKSSIRATYANKSISEDILDEIKDYFRNQQDEDYLSFDDHPLSDIESLMDPKKPAPWDHLTNDEDDEDVDIDIKDEKQ